MTPKEQAIRMRRRGTSIRDIETRLGIARSTLSYWFRNIKIATIYQERLRKRWAKALVGARKKAIQWHHSQKESRIVLAHQEATKSLDSLEINTPTIELALAMLYLGEGSKGSSLSLGNSDPHILHFFLSAIEQLYGLQRKLLKYELHLRADQDPPTLIHYWAKELRVPAHRFSKPSVDQRTTGRPTYPSYQGVCIVQCGNIAIQRKLVYISTLFCRRVAHYHKRA